MFRSSTVASPPQRPEPSGRGELFYGERNNARRFQRARHRTPGMLTFGRQSPRRINENCASENSSKSRTLTLEQTAPDSQAVKSQKCLCRRHFYKVLLSSIGPTCRVRLEFSDHYRITGALFSPGLFHSRRHAPVARVSLRARPFLLTTARAGSGSTSSSRVPHDHLASEIM
jgi:hypothetical protein